MRMNEGLWDRALRVVGGLALIGLAVTEHLGPWAYLGVVPLVTGALGRCPLYAILGIRTCPLDPR